MAYRGPLNTVFRSLDAHASLVAGAAISATLAVCATELAAQESAGDPRHAVAADGSSLAELERSFWVCDHATTRTGIDAMAVMACSVVVEDLKRRKFNGEFDAMHHWWRANKDSEYLALDRRAGVPGPSDPVGLR